MKRNYRQMKFFERMGKDMKTQIENVLIEQNRWLKIMQEEHLYMSDQNLEQDNASFYENNQSWIMDEIKDYLKINDDKVKGIRERKVDTPKKPEISESRHTVSQ